MKFYKILFTVTTAALLTTGCNKLEDFGDTNVDPNTTAVPSTAALLTNAQSGLGNFINTNGTVYGLTHAGLYAQQFSETQYTETSLYALPKLNFDVVYAGPLYDLQNIINTNSDPATAANSTKFGANVNQIAIARILKAYIFWTITDRWGDIPYSEALKGEGNLTPKYDKQEDIYKDLIKELKEAADQFDVNGAVVTGDVMYGKASNGTTNVTTATQVAKWRKLANSLRMVIALRTSKVYPNAGEWAATEFNAAFTDADGYIGANADNFTLNYTGSVAAFRHPFFRLFETRHDYAESKLMTDYMASLSDPRQAAFGSSTVGFPYGLTREEAVDFASDHANYAEILAASKRANNSPYVIIGADDVLLAIAEAAQRGWVAADPVTFYRNGITTSWEQWGVTGNIGTYYNNAQVDLGVGSALQKIQLQQYFAWYPDGIQAWANWRRTGVPALTPPPAANDPIPRRFVYGTNEYAVNSANVADAASRYTGGDDQDSRVWWDKP
jgi:hypothetical protein